MPTMTDERSRLRELDSAIKSRVDALDNLTAHFKIEESKDAAGGRAVIVSTEQRDDFQKQVKDIKALRELRSEVTEAMRFKEFGGFNDAGERAFSTALVAGTAGQGETKSYRNIAAAFTDSQEFKSRNGVKMSEPGWAFPGDLTAEARPNGFHALEGKDIYTGYAFGGPTDPGVAPTNPRGFGTVQRDPAVPLAMRTSRVRDLFPAAATSANLIEYFRFLGLVGTGQQANSGYGNPGNAGMVPERSGISTATPGGTAFGMKPQSTMQLVNDQAIVRTIAHWEAAHRNVLDDEPQLQALITNELLYGLRLVEDYQILNGDGTGENLRGILHTPGIQTYSADVDTPATALNEQFSDSIRRAVTRVTLAYYDPSGVIIHPFDWEQIELQKNLQGSYIIATSIAIGGVKQLWRMPVVDTPAMVEGQFLVGAFGQGAQLYDRQQSNIRTADQHADFFVRNAVVILAEERLALAVKRPESFVLGTFATGPVGAGATNTTTIAVTPGTATVAHGLTQRLTVNATENGGTENVTTSATYSSSAPSIATVDGNGLVTTIAAGTATITATFHGSTGTSVITVS